MVAVRANKEKKSGFLLFLNRNLADVVRDAKQSPFNLGFFNPFKQEAVKAFVVFNVSKDRFYICGPSLSVINSFFGL